MNETMERLYQAAREEKGIEGIGAQTAVANLLNVSPQVVKNWESRGISQQGILNASMILKINPVWLKTGQGNMKGDVPASSAQETASTKIAATENVASVGSYLFWSSNSPLPEDDFAHLPFYKDVVLAAGTGSFADVDYNGFTLPFAKATLYRYGVSPGAAICISIKGDSMEPVLPSGSTVGVDTSKKAIIDGKMYAFRQEDMLRIKRLYRLPGGMVLIRSFNQDDPAYKDEEIALSEIEIIGRVFTSSTMWI